MLCGLYNEVLYNYESAFLEGSQRLPNFQLSLYVKTPKISENFGVPDYFATGVTSHAGKTKKISKLRPIIIENYF
jgi:hypothetical protein